MNILNSRLLILFVLGILLSCEATVSSNSGEEKPQAKKESKKNKEISNTKLNSDKAVEFFLNHGKRNLETIVLIQTSFGDIKIKLFEDTPIHRSNFIYLAKKDYFNTTWFHRVSEGHVIQAGNSDSDLTSKARNSIGAYSLPSEMTDHNYHAYGAVAAARSYKRNPNKRSNPFEFYISLGQKFSIGQLKAMKLKYDVEFTEEQKSIYSTIGGSPHLDHEHTVFGQVIEGMEVVGKISRVEVDSGEWPLNNVPIKVKVLK